MSAAPIWLSSCSIVRGPMIAEVTAGWRMREGDREVDQAHPASSASTASASATSSLRWFSGSDMS